MEPARIVKDEWEVEGRLQELFGVSKADLIRVALTAVGARRDAVDDDPINAPGIFSYIYGTRAIRQVFRAQGWRRHRAGGVESVVSAERGRQVIFQNADLAADVQDPKAISDKGSSTERAVRMGQGNLFPEWQQERERVENAVAWYFFVSCQGDDVRAELSLPRAVEDGQFYGFHERIFIVRRGELAEFRFDASGGEPPAEFDVTITRK